MIVLRWLRVQWDRVLAVTVVGAGILALVIGWAGISDEVFAARQLPYLLSGGVGGLFLLGVGATLWLSADLRDEWHQLRRIEQRMAATAEPSDAGPERPGNAHRPATADYTTAQAPVGSGQFRS
ncbi:MAG: hypothetical protein AB1679_03415 [Actinomycetota bacterium]